MLELLYQAQKELPRLLQLEDWNSVDVTYHAPRVERVWRPWNENRISLHVIHPCNSGEDLFHPHPWPSAMKIVRGYYEMVIGYGEGIEPPSVACKVILTPGSYYEMTNKNGWHGVRPIENPCYTVMISGSPWNREMPEEPKTKQGPLPPERVREILTQFRYHYS